MIPKEKALDLIHSFYYALPNNGSSQGINSTTRRYQEAIRCALVALRETVWGYLDQYPIEVQQYWQEVRKEIEKRYDSKATN